MWTNGTILYFLALCLAFCSCQEIPPTNQSEPLIQGFGNDSFQVALRKNQQFVELFYCFSLGSCDPQIFRYEIYPIVQEQNERLIFDIGSEKYGEITMYFDSIEICKNTSTLPGCIKLKKEGEDYISNEFFNPEEKSFLGFLGENISTQEELLMKYRVEANLGVKFKKFIDVAEHYKAIILEKELNLKLTQPICWYQIEDLDKVVWSEYIGDRSGSYVKLMIEDIIDRFLKVNFDSISENSTVHSYPFINSILNNDSNMKKLSVGEIIICINSLILEIYEENEKSM